MRKAIVLTCLVVLLAADVSAECITIAIVKPREFISQSTDVARAVGVSPYEARITAVLFGKHAAGDIIVFPPHGCCGTLVAGKEYYVRTTCPSGSDCFWSYIDVEKGDGFEEYIKQRHDVTRAAVIEKLRSWQRHEMATDDFQRWLATADAHDNDVEGPSLTFAVLEQIENLLEFLDDAKSCQPADVARFREHGSQVLLDRFARLPREEKLSAYEEWLDAHDDSPDEWDARALRKDLDAALEADPAWHHATTCIDELQQKRALAKLR